MLLLNLWIKGAISSCQGSLLKDLLRRSANAPCHWVNLDFSPIVSLSLSFSLSNTHSLSLCYSVSCCLDKHLTGASGRPDNRWQMPAAKSNYCCSICSRGQKKEGENIKQRYFQGSVAVWRRFSCGCCCCCCLSRSARTHSSELLSRSCVERFTAESLVVRWSWSSGCSTQCGRLQKTELSQKLVVSTCSSHKVRLFILMLHTQWITSSS